MTALMLFSVLLPSAIVGWILYETQKPLNK